MLKYPSIYRVSETPFISLLRNMKLLAGMSERSNSKVLVSGFNNKGIIAALTSIEPTLDIVGTEDVSPESLSKYAGFNADAVIVNQPYHVLRSKDDFKALRNCVHPQHGKTGFFWSRATKGTWVDEYEKIAAAKFPLPSNVKHLPNIESSVHPVDYFDNLNLEDVGLSPVKCKSSLESFRPNVAEEISEVLPYVIDLRVDPAQAEAAFNAWREAGSPGYSGKDGIPSSIPLTVYAMYSTLLM